MTDFFGNGYFGEYFSDGYFGPTAATNPGSMSASLSGSGDITAALSATSVEVNEGHSGGFVQFAGRHNLIGRHYRPVRLLARKAIKRLEEGEDISETARKLAVMVAEKIKQRPQDKSLATVRDIAKAALPLAALGKVEDKELKASLLKIEAAAMEFAEMVEEDDAIVAILLAA